MAYAVTHSKVRNAFNTLNKQVFSNQLDFESVELDIDFLDTEWGFCISEDGEIILGLTDEFPNRKSFVDVLCHEMIHLYQIVNNLNVDHKSTFKKWAKSAEKLGHHV